MRVESIVGLFLRDGDGKVMGNSFTQGVLGATAVGLAYLLPSFLMVLGLSAAYVRFGGLPWMQAMFYGIGAAVIGIITRSKS